MGQSDIWLWLKKERDGNNHKFFTAIEIMDGMKCNPSNFWGLILKSVDAGVIEQKTIIRKNIHDRNESYRGYRLKESSWKRMNGDING